MRAGRRRSGIAAKAPIEVRRSLDLLNSEGQLRLPLLLSKGCLGLVRPSTSPAIQWTAHSWSRSVHPMALSTGQHLRHESMSNSKSLEDRIRSRSETLTKYGSLGVLPSGHSLRFNHKTNSVVMRYTETGSHIVKERTICIVSKDGSCR